MYDLLCAGRKCAFNMFFSLLLLVLVNIVYSQDVPHRKRKNEYLGYYEVLTKVCGAEKRALW